MKPLAPNTLLQNRYLIVQLIGKGGMGEVYLAVDQRLGSAIALKRTFFSDDETLGNAFEREARTLARLRHPSLPKVSDHFTENDTQYLVMEHISGDDLSKRLEITNKPFPVSWVLFWADQLLDALAYLHSHEPPIVHRDIKPQNLKLTDENHIVLLDFGLAKNSMGNTRVSTTGGSIVGYTPHYAPMEQIRGTGTNARSDLYSLAATLYQLLANQVPPDALSRADSVLNGMGDPVEPLNEINLEVSPAVSTVILKGMSLSSEQRWASAREMQKALREAYSQLQQVMSAQTVAFNSEADTGAATGAIQNASSSQANTAGYATPHNSQPPAMKTQPPATGYDSYGAGKSSNVTAAPVSQSNAAPVPDFDATLKMDSPMTGAPSFGEKTEVLPSGISSLPTAAEQNYDPQATYPLVNFDSRAGQTQAGQTQAAGGYNSQPQNYNSQPNQPSAATFVAGHTAQATNETFAPQPLYAEPKKKSAGKALAVAGGVGGLGIVAIAAAGIGWYALKSDPVTVNPTPTPQATVEPARSVEPTPAPTVEALSGNTNSSGEVVSSSNTANTNATPAVTPQPSETQAARTRTDRPVERQTPGRTAPTPRVATVATPQPRETPVRNSPDAGKPGKTPDAGRRRTDILQ